MDRSWLHRLGAGLLVASGLSPLAAPAQDPLPPVDPPPAQSRVPDGGGKVTALTEGPLHEAFLSPAKDREPSPVRQGPAGADRRAARRRPPAGRRPVDRGLLGV